MKYYFTLLPLLLLFTMRSCDNRVEAPDGPSFNLGDTLVLTKTIPLNLSKEKLTLTYATLKDNRCPDGVNCFVAGEAKVGLTVAVPPTSETANLEVKGLCQDRKGKCGNTATSSGYQIKILSADPYPGSDASKADVVTETIRVVVQKAK